MAQNRSQEIKNDINLFSKYLATNSDSAKYYIQRAYTKSIVYKNDSLIARTSYNFGYYYYLKSDITSSKYYINKAIEYSNQSNFNKILSLSYNQAGTIATDENQFAKALKLYLIAFDIVARHREAVYPARLNVGSGSYVGEEHTDFTARQRHNRGRLPFVRNVDHLDTGLHTEQFAGEVRAGPGTGRGVGECFRSGLCQVDQRFHGAGGNRRMHHQEIRRIGNHRDRGETLHCVITQILVEVAGDQQRRPREVERVAIRRRARRIRRSDRRAGTGLRLDDDGLTPALGELLAERACLKIRGPARRKLGSLTRIALRACRAASAALNRLRTTPHRYRVAVTLPQI